MSGKKESDVMPILEQGEEVRKLTDGIFSKEITDCYGRYRAILQDVAEIKRSAKDTTAELNSEAKEMFGADGQKLLDEIARVKESLDSQSVTDKGKNITAELARLDEKLAAADKEAQSIRDSVKDKVSRYDYYRLYLDDEWKRAKVLLETYENLRSERVELERRMKSLLSSESQNASSARSDSSLLQNLAQQVADMNAMAKKRKQANAFRKELQSALDALDAPNAEKFFEEGFANLKRSTAEIIALNDDRLLSNFQKQYAAITEFKTCLTKRVALWQKHKDDAEARFEQMERAAAQTFLAPVDQYNEAQDGQTLNLFDYLKTYGGKDLGGEYRRQHDEAAELMRQEHFSGSMEVMSAAIDLAETARQEALKLQESMLKKLELAGAIQDVMYEMNYDTALEIINDNPNDGFKIKCAIGGETIDFERVDIDSDGKVVVKIDHHEIQGANCSAAWCEITRHLNEVGIPLTDVRMENGNSVLRGGQRIAANQGQRALAH